MTAKFNSLSGCGVLAGHTEIIDLNDTFNVTYRQITSVEFTVTYGDKTGESDKGTGIQLLHIRSTFCCGHIYPAADGIGEIRDIKGNDGSSLFNVDGFIGKDHALNRHGTHALVQFTQRYCLFIRENRTVYGIGIVHLGCFFSERIPEAALSRISAFECSCTSLRFRLI